MHFNQAKQGFTLIELLVVVLIIGILAAVAIPQYQKAVWKSRQTQHLINLKTLYNAFELYRLSNGDYPVLPNGYNYLKNIHDLFDLEIDPSSPSYNYIFAYYEGGKPIFLRNDGLHPTLNIKFSSGKFVCSEVSSNTEALLKCKTLCGKDVSAQEGFGSDQPGCYIQ